MENRASECTSSPLPFCHSPPSSQRPHNQRLHNSSLFSPAALLAGAAQHPSRYSLQTTKSIHAVMQFSIGIDRHQQTTSQSSRCLFYVTRSDAGSARLVPAARQNMRKVCDSQSPSFRTGKLMSSARSNWAALPYQQTTNSVILWNIQTFPSTVYSTKA